MIGTGQCKGNRKKLKLKNPTMDIYSTLCDYMGSLLQRCSSNSFRKLGHIKQIITRGGCWICLNIALNASFTF